MEPNLSSPMRYVINHKSEKGQVSSVRDGNHNFARRGFQAKKSMSFRHKVVNEKG